MIPRSMRHLVKERLHSAHLGNDSMMRRARDLVFWPGMSKEIKQLADSCEIERDMEEKQWIHRLQSVVPRSRRA